MSEALVTHDTPARLLPGVVYAARVLFRRVAWVDNRTVVDDLGYGWKIGFTTNLVSRVIGLVGSARDVELVAAFRSTRGYELSAHRALRPSAITAGPDGYPRAKAREWYADTGEVREFIAAMPAAWRGSIRLLAVERDPERASCYVRDTSYATALRNVQCAWRAAMRGR